MDKAKGLMKGGWKPSGDISVSRDTWKSDLKGIATGKKNDPAADSKARDHQSAPLASLRDPESFGPPPKHSGYHGNTQSPTRTLPATPSLGSPAPSPSTRSNPQRRQGAGQEQEEEAPPPGPYRVNTTGLRTDNLPKPPTRRDDSPATRAETPTGARPVPKLPPRAAAGPPPTLPPRQNEFPDDYTPPPPPTYGEATQPAQNPASLNQSAMSRLGQAGVAVPALGIGGNSNPTPSESPSARGHPSQLSELQQRFARMSAKSPSSSEPAQRPSWQQTQTPTTPSSATGAFSPGAAFQRASNVAANKKPPPPPPPAKRTGLGATSPADQAEPPPIPTSSKPRPT